VRRKKPQSLRYRAGHLKKRGRWREGGREEKRSHARRNLYDLDTAIDAAVDV